MIVTAGRVHTYMYVYSKGGFRVFFPLDLEDKQCEKITREGIQVCIRIQCSCYKDMLLPFGVLEYLKQGEFLKEFLVPVSGTSPKRKKVPRMCVLKKNKKE